MLIIPMAERHRGPDAAVTMSASGCSPATSNTSESTVEKWESGAKRPSPPLRKLLSVVVKNTACRSSPSAVDLDLASKAALSAPGPFASVLDQRRFLP